RTRFPALHRTQAMSIESIVLRGGSMSGKFFGKAVSAGFGALLALSSTAQAGEIDWAPSFEAALERARAEDKFVMVDFYTNWCHWCRVLDQKTYSVPEVQALAERVASVKVDADKRQESAAAYGATVFPPIAARTPVGAPASG